MKTEEQKQVEKERTRMVVIIQVLKAVVEHKASTDAAFVPSYVALSDYLTTALHRLVAQDWRFISMIRKRVAEKEGVVSAEVEGILEEVQDMLCGALLRVGRSEAATGILKKQGAAVLDDIKPIAGELSRYTTEDMGHHAPSVNIAAKYFSQEDWSNMSQSDDQVIERENQQYDAVFEALQDTPLELTREDIEHEVDEMVANWLAK